MTTPFKQFRVVIKNHVPAHKTAGSVQDNVCEFKVKHYDGTAKNPKPWLEITTTEIYSLTDSKRTQHKVSIFTLEGEQLEEFLKYIKNIS